MQDRFSSNNVFFRQLLFIAVLLVIGIVIFNQLKFFIGAFLGAITLYILLRPWQKGLSERRKWKPWIASLLLVSITTILFLALGFLLFEIVAAEIPAVDRSDIVPRLNTLLKQINDATGFNIVPEKIISSSASTITNLVSSALNTTYSFAANMFMMLLILYFMLANFRKMESAVLLYIPFRGDSLKVLEKQVSSMIFSNAVGIPLIMFVQFAAACFIYWILGLKGFLFWAFITAICGLIPVVGTGIVWLPISVYYFTTGEIWQAVVLLLYGVLVISNVDNLTRIVLMKKTTDTHPLIVIFGVILGIPLFGFWGIIFGPLLISAFLLLIKIYFIEYDLINKKDEKE